MPPFEISYPVTPTLSLEAPQVKVILDVVTPCCRQGRRLRRRRRVRRLRRRVGWRCGTAGGRAGEDELRRAVTTLVVRIDTERVGRAAHETCDRERSRSRRPDQRAVHIDAVTRNAHVVRRADPREIGGRSRSARNRSTKRRRRRQAIRAVPPPCFASNVLAVTLCLSSSVK